MIDLIAEEWTHEQEYEKNDYRVLRNKKDLIGVVYNEDDARLIATVPEMYQWIMNARKVLLDWSYRIIIRGKNYHDENIAEFSEAFFQLIRSSDSLLGHIYWTEGDPE